MTFIISISEFSRRHYMVSTLLPPTHNLHCANNNSGDRSLGLWAELAVILGSSDWLSGLHDETVLSGLCYPLFRPFFFFVNHLIS
jgi:hypothetical protein